MTAPHARTDTYPRTSPGLLRTLVVGAGEAGRALARDLLRVPEFGLLPVGFLDDDPGKRPSRHAVDDADVDAAADVGAPGATLPLLGPLERTGQVVTVHRIEVVVVAIPGLLPHRFALVAEAAAAAGASVRYLPSFIAALRRDVVGGDLRALDVNKLIGRQEVHVVSTAARAGIEGRRVLVTGAGGSIGGELCRQVHAFGPSRLFLLDHDESNLHRLQLELFGAPRHDEDLVICDIRDRGRLEHVFDRLRPDVVFHAAAHKHLPMLELHPCEGVKSNVLGTDRLIRVAGRYGVERFVLISTDKAADPISVLGATKRLAELIVQAAPNGPTVCTAVRFGNVLGSRGSLLDVLAAQLRSGRPVTVTHPEMTRFFMTIEEAAGLVLEAGRMARGGEVFVLDMGRPVRILDLVRRYAQQLNAGPPQIRFTGLRPGEKLDETLFSVNENRQPTAHPRIHATTPRNGHATTEALRQELPGLYSAAWHDDATEVRRRLARLLPGFPPPQPAWPEQLVGAVPYPDDF